MRHQAPPRHVVFATDSGYWNHTIVAAFSLLSNLDSCNYYVYIICDDVPSRISRHLRWMSQRFPRSTIQTLVLNHQQIVSTYLVRDHLTSATYYRFFVDRLLPNNVDLVLYLDSDTIVNRSLDSLFNYDLQDCVVAAVPEIDSQSDIVRLNLPNHPGYFNAGVLLINLQAWRVLQITDQLLEICSNRPDQLTWPSQDPLNLILKDLWTPLPSIYNYNHGYSALVPARRAKPRPAIIHFSGTPKPWTLGGLSLESLPFWSAVFKTPSWHWFLASLFHSVVNSLQRSIGSTG